MGPFIGRPLASLTVDDLRRVVDNQIPESLHLDYKRDLLLNTQDEKKEFLRDLVAFANSEGGTIIYGVGEERDAGNKPTGLPRTVDGFDVPNRDAFTLSMESIIKDGIDERLPSREISFVRVAGNRMVLAIRIPPSLRAPHMVIFGGERRFFMRANGGRQEMSTAQIRDAVLRTESITDRIRAFIQSRIEKLEQATSGAFIALHVIPLNRIHSALDVTDEAVIQRLMPICTQFGGSSTHCIEGYKVWSKHDDGTLDHVLVFRDGTVEFLEQYSFGNDKGQKYVAYPHMEATQIRLVESALSLYANGHLQLPAVIAISMARIKGHIFPMRRSRNTPAEENTMTTEPLVITELPDSAATAVRPLLDFIWNAFGMRCCLGYDPETGEYVGYRQ